MHPIDDYTVFTRIADRQSFTMAGRELRMSTAVVSSRIAKIEDRLGQKLFVRNTRQISMTEEGKIFYNHCQKMMAEIAALEKQFAEFKNHPAGALRISVPVTLGRKIITPIIPEFGAENPDVQVRLQITDRLADIMGEDIDIAVRKGNLEPSTYITKKLAPDLRIVCGAPSYFENSGMPLTPEDLKAHNCLLLRFPGSRRYYWQFETDGGAIKNIMVSGTLDSNSSDALIDWAIAGHGLIMKSVWDLYDHLQAKRLCPVLLPYTIRNMNLQLLMPPRKNQPVKTRAFTTFLSKTFKDHPAAKLTNIQALQPMVWS